jgi:hypothetical protein
VKIPVPQRGKESMEPCCDNPNIVTAEDDYESISACRNCHRTERLASTQSPMTIDIPDEYECTDYEIRAKCTWDAVFAGCR